ncbi:cytochrome c oxidase accessory protein CcoG [Portibacter lacus]|nr:cytochrome c oxidase accessory protein CcoG [Portibacter lacus]
MEDFIEDEEGFRDELATVDKSGKRIWIYPKMPKGIFYKYRKWLSYLLLLTLFGLPWIKWNGSPLVLLNILERKFIIFGIYFPPQDFFLFVIAMLIFMVFIALFTVIFGRLFCGWICPQTIFMEMVYRRIEYWIEGDANAQRRLNNAPWTKDKILKKTIKQILFFGIAVLIANTFLAYIIGVDEVINIIKEPISMHLNGFIAMIVFSFIFYGVFAFLREQVCTTICPYGRLQGVLLDKQSLAVYYDFERGEPRGKMKKKVEPETPALGDCIDCNLCVKVCPTGIDIRNGIQLECVNCTACMDACDEVMEKIERPKGLIRLDSYEGIVNKKHKLINKRSIAYSSVLLILLVLESFLFINRSEVDVLMLRTPGTMYYELEDGTISNLFNYQLTNKTGNVYKIEFVCTNIDDVEFEFAGEHPTTVSNGNSEGAVFIKIPKSKILDRKTNLKISVMVGDREIDQVKTTFLGPIK